MRMTGAMLYVLIAPFVMGVFGIGTTYLVVKLTDRSWVWWLAPLVVLGWLLFGYVPVSSWN